MTEVGSWGCALQAHRKKLRLTQGQLIEDLSQLVAQLSEAEKAQLIDARIYDEAAAYFGGILDPPTLSRLEKGTRTLNTRPRCVALVWGLNRLGAIDAIEEANHFLELGGHGNLTTAEARAIFPDQSVDGARADLQVVEQPESTQLQVHATQPSKAKTAPAPAGWIARRLIWFGAAGLLGVMLVSLIFYYLNGMDGDAAERENGQPTQTVSSNSPSPPSARHALLADRLISEQGEIGNGHLLYNLHELDLKGSADRWDNYVKFLPENEEAYVGFRVYQVPQHIPRDAITTMRVEANFRGAAFEEQAWVWRIFNLTTTEWERLGDNRDAPWWGDWHLLSFDVAGAFVDYVNADDEILVEVQSSNGSDGMDLDYEAIIIEWTAEP